MEYLSLFLNFLKDFYTFAIIYFYIYKKVYLPTDPKNIGEVTGNKIFFLLA